MVVGNKPSKFRTILRVSTSTKATAPSRKSNYQGQDSNLHAFRHQILSLARLPIPPPWQISTINTVTHDSYHRHKPAVDTMLTVWHDFRHEKARFGCPAISASSKVQIHT